MLLCHVIKPIITEDVKSMQLKKCTHIFFSKVPHPSAFRNRLESCNCVRCQDPTEFGSYLSAMKCPKCPKDKNSPLLPENPTDPDSVWKCLIHRKMQIPAKAVQQLAIDLQMDLYSGT